MPLTKLILHKRYADRIGKQRWTLRFEPGVNLLIGPNGSGKSTVIECLQREVLVKEKKDRWGHKERDQKRYATYDFEGDPMPIFYFDFEKDNPRVGEIGSLEDLGAIKRMSMSWKYKALSHGQFTKDVLKELQAKASTGRRPFVVMDEPEQALDLDGLRDLHKILTTIPMQAVVATHHPFIIADPTFNCIETRPGYRDEVMAALVACVDPT